MNLFFLDNPRKSGIFNCGTGASQTFNDVAVAAVNALRAEAGENPLPLQELAQQGVIEYVPFHAGLKSKYQSFTEADLSGLRAAGYDAPFFNVQTGVARYVEWLLEAGY